MTFANETITEADYRLVRDLVYQHSRIALGANKQELVAGRIRKRLRHLGMNTFREYCRFLLSAEGSAEIPSLIDAISTNHTDFFRDPQQFEFLQKEVLQRLDLSLRSERRKYRVWSAACSSGEEPYSIAICLAEFFSRAPGWTWELEASDISTKMLAVAAAGIYPRDEVKLSKPDWLRRYFQRGCNEFTGYYRVKSQLRSQVRFHHLNLFQSRYPFTSGFDVIFCRNVMIYFDATSQQQLVRRLTDALIPGGLLFVGTSESLIGTQHSLGHVRPSIYRKLAC